VRFDDARFRVAVAVAARSAPIPAAAAASRRLGEIKSNRVASIDR
jgi:hypothetical protein